MQNALTREQKDELVGIYSHLTKAKQDLTKADECPYLVSGSSALALAEIVRLQESLERVLISGDLPIQPVPVVARNFIGQRKE